KLSDEEKQRVLDQYNNVPDEQKWTLSTGTIVDDQIKQLVTQSLFEHPVHSMILAPTDSIWMTYFTQAELHEIKTHHPKPLKQLPKELNDYLDS
ncbi:hypothetical protein BC941DRAFT_337286, partial [Chlamydoabsidia padenii]